MRSYLYPVVLLASIASHDSANAWGNLGHEVVCEIAFRELPPQVRSKVTSLIHQDSGVSRLRQVLHLAGQSEDPPVRALLERASFRNKDREAAPCGGASKCAATAIANDMRDLATNSDEADQLRLIKSIGHWVGDIHQPLHVSFEDDRGANKIDVDAPCDSSLHSVWDTCIIEEKIGTRAREIAVDLRGEITDQDRSRWVPARVDTAAIVGWANELLAITLRPSVQYCVQKQGECWYTATQKTYPGNGPKKKVDANDAYLGTHAPIVRDRLKMAGVRLAAVLTTALAQAESAAGPSALRAPEAASVAALEPRRSMTLTASSEQWQALLFRLDRLESAMHSLTQELKSVRADRPAPRQ